ncbi:coiled-coil domain-containing protein [Tenacibaculum sp.]|uniref:coiled-coil domain-containing protein n=1 Tax=Tenacibaculum sp. TaxID=1906242 RepID=UPI003D0F3DDC
MAELKTKISVSKDRSRYEDGVKTHRALPPQKVPYNVKYGKEWPKNNVDAIIGMSMANSQNGRSSRRNKKINYDIVNSRFKQSDFSHVLNPYGITDARFQGSATKMQNYNIIRTPLETLKGEEMKMGLNFRAVAINGEAVNEKRAERTKALKKATIQRTMAIVSGDINPETGQPNTQEDPKDIIDFFKTKYANPTEVATNKLLKYLTHKDLLQMKFSKGWEHALISSEEIYFLSIVGGHPSVRACNPLNVEFDRETDSPFIHESDWAMEERWMPVGTVIDLYGDQLKDEDIERLDNGELGGMGFSSNGQYRDFAYDFNGGTDIEPNMGTNTSHIYVANVAWKSYKKIGHLKYISQRTGMVESTTVDESFKMTPDLKESGAVLTWEWVTEVWVGTRIGHDIYVGVRPMENQTGKLPYVGYIYNNINSTATSIVDMVKAHQYTYIIVWWRLEQELAKAKGKKFIMDLAQLPKSKGWTTDQWMYYFDNMGVAWINSREEGRKDDPTTQSKFNQFQAVDMTLSTAISQYMVILQKLEDQVERITGVSPQRAGDIGRSETATGAQRAIIQSTNNTKPLFFYHDLVRQGVMQELLELCKVAYADGLDIEYAVDEKTIETLKIDAGMLNGTNLGVFVTNSFDEAMNKEKLERYLDVALQQDKATLSDIVAVLGSNSISEIRDTLIAGENAKIERDSKAAQEANATQERINQANLADKKEERDQRWAEAKLKSDTTILVAEIGEQSSGETNDELDQRKQELAERKQSTDERIKNEELELKKRAQQETERSNKAKENNKNVKN